MSWKTLERTFSTDTRLQAHWAVQVPAAIGDQRIPQRPDWSHSALEWLPDRRLLATEPTENRIRGALSLDDLSVLLLDPNGQESGRFSLRHQNLEDGFAWLGQQIGGTLTFSQLVIPEHPVRTEARPLDPKGSELSRLADWFANAHSICETVRAEDTRASATKIWPHHFDMATLVNLDANVQGEEARSIGLGFSPGDSHYDEPYFYVMPWPYPDKTRLVPVDALGHWHTEGWTGGALLVSQLPPAAQEAKVLKFVREYKAVCEQILS